MRVFYYLIISLLCSCTQNDSISGRYYDKQGLNNVFLHQQKDSIKGYHCLVSTNGKFIDCFLTSDDTISIKGKKVNKNVFEGKMKSNYDTLSRQVRIQYYANKVLLIMNNHPFVKDTLLFEKNNRGLLDSFKRINEVNHIH